MPVPLLTCDCATVVDVRRLENIGLPYSHGVPCALARRKTCALAGVTAAVLSGLKMGSELTGEVKGHQGSR